MNHGLREIMGDVIKVAGADLDVFEPWIALAEELGPTPLSGPLRHDILLPTPWSRQVAVNVFEVADKPVGIWDTAIAQAERLWGNGAIVSELQAQVPAGVACHWGCMWRNDAYRLKAYFGDRGGLEELARRLRIEWAGGTLCGLALDIGPAGFSRARSYFVGVDAPLEVADMDGVAHQIVSFAPKKRSLNIIFEPDAEMEQLLAAAESVPAPSCLIPELIARFPDHVRPVAYEADCAADGVHTDVLVTVGARSDFEQSHGSKGDLRLTMARNER